MPRAPSLSRPDVAVLLCGLVVWLSGCASYPSGAGGWADSEGAVTHPGLRPVRTIVVDAGHGGHDPGATHHGLTEKHLSLDIARELAGHLSAYGFSVLMTRDRDEFVSLGRRAALANERQADLFVSVHVNANRSRSVSGLEVYYPSESAMQTSASLPPRLAASQVALPTAIVRHILWDLLLMRSRGRSVQLARAICQKMHAALGTPCRRVRGARFVVLRKAWMPAVLVEVGYMSNRAEAERLAEPTYRQAIARAIAEGVVSYVRAVQGQAT